MMSNEDHKDIRSMPGNDKCVDCSQLRPEWACVSFGVLFCLECSGRHRGLGTHVSFVRSVTMDGWNEKQIRTMKAGGNRQWLDYARKYDIEMNGANRTANFLDVYDCEAARNYKYQLQERLGGRPNELDVSNRLRKHKKVKDKGAALMKGSSTSLPVTNPAEEAHSITTSLLRTKSLLQQNLQRTNEASNVLNSDYLALKQALHGQKELGGTVKGANSALRELKLQDIWDRLVLCGAISFYCAVVLYIFWSRAKIPYLS